MQLLHGQLDKKRKLLPQQFLLLQLLVMNNRRPLMNRIFWMVSSISLIACSGFPTLHPYVLSVVNGQCIPCSHVGPSNACTDQFTCDATQAVPLSQCDGFTALSPSDIAALKQYQAQ